MANGVVPCSWRRDGGRGSRRTDRGLRLAAGRAGVCGEGGLTGAVYTAVLMVSTELEQKVNDRANGSHTLTLTVMARYT
jgi:hypothetical protein